MSVRAQRREKEARRLTTILFLADSDSVLRIDLGRVSLEGFVQYVDRCGHVSRILSTVCCVGPVYFISNFRSGRYCRRQSQIDSRLDLDADSSLPNQHGLPNGRRSTEERWPVSKAATAHVDPRHAAGEKHQKFHQRLEQRHQRRGSRRRRSARTLSGARRYGPIDSIGKCPIGYGPCRRMAWSTTG